MPMPVRATTFFVCLWTVLFTIPVFAQPPVGNASEASLEKPAFPSIPAAVKALGDDDFEVRQGASDFLWRTGKPAQPLLEESVRSPDAEVRLRATLLLRKIRLGINPDTPLEVQQLIAEYYGGDRNQRQQVINTLRAKGSFPTIFALLQIETDLATRQLFFTTLRSDVNRFAPQMIASGDWTLLEQWLELGKDTDAGRSQLTAYWLLRDKLPAEFEKAQEAWANNPGDAAAATLVAYLLRAQGKSEQALATLTAIKTPPPTLLQALVREQADWARLSKLYETKGENPRLESHRLAQRAMAHRLAHDPEKADVDLAQVAKLAPDDDVWYGAKVQLLNDRPAKALKLLRGNLQPLAFELLVQRQEHVAALELAGIEDDTVFDEAWLNRLSGQQSVRTSRTVDRFAYAVNIAAELRLVGKLRQYDRLHAFLTSTAELDDRRGVYWQQLARLERGPGRQRELLDKQGRAVDRNQATVFSQMFNKRLQPMALIWWESLEIDTLKVEPKFPTATDRLTAVAVALLPKTFPDQGEKIWNAALECAIARAKVPAIDPTLRARIHVAIAEAWLARSNKEQAEKHFREATAANAIAAEAYGDFLLTEERWTDAVTQYRTLVDANPGHIVGWYLLGIVQLRAGNKEEGEKAQRTANLMALDAPARYQLALALQDRSLREDARTQWLLLQRTAPPDDQYATITNQYLGTLSAEQNPLAAAKYWEQTRFHLLRPTTNLIEQAGYLDYSASIHRLHARHLLSNGDKAGAIEMLRRHQQLLPGNIKVVEEFVPLLRKADLAEAADDLFENCFQTYAQATERFPESATFHNQAAWVAALSGRRLDDALALAEEAVRLAPESASYADTLAEVHFARGERELALEWSRKSLALDPNSKFHAERLESFRTRELPQ